MGTLVAMATVHEKIKMTFPMKLAYFNEHFIFSIDMMVIQDLAKRAMIRNSRWPS